jgi:hypothetical protein
LDYNNKLSGSLPPEWSTLSSLRLLYATRPLPGTQWLLMNEATLKGLDCCSLCRDMYDAGLSGNLPKEWSTLTSAVRMCASGPFIDEHST